MGCTSAKQVSAVPSDEDGRAKAYSNGDLYTDEYRMKAVEEVKYMRGEEDRVSARNQENLEKSSTQYRGKPHKEGTGATNNRQISTRQRASRSSSRCWTRRLKRDVTTARKKRM